MESCHESCFLRQSKDYEGWPLNQESNTVSLGKYVLSSWQSVWTTSWKLIVCLWRYRWSQNGLVLVSNILWIPLLASCKILPFPSCLPLAACGDIWWCLVLVATPQTQLWKQHATVPCSDALLRLAFQHLWVSFGVSTLISFRWQLPLKSGRWRSLQTAVRVTLLFSVTLVWSEEQWIFQLWIRRHWNWSFLLSSSPWLYLLGLWVS